MRIRKVFSSKKGTAEIVGTILFLVILFFFFSNVFLWHNQITKEMDQVVANKMNAAVRIEIDTVIGKNITMKVTNLGGLDIILSRLWIINSTETAIPTHDHLYAELKPLSSTVRIQAGSQKIILLGNSTETLFSGEGVKAETAGNNIRVQYVPPAGQTVIFKIISEYGNTAACSYSFPPD